MPPTSREFEVVRLAATIHVDERRAALLSSAAEGADWNRVLELAGHHRTLSLLHAHFRDHAPTSVPPPVAAALRSNARRVAMLGLMLSSEMARVGEGLSREGVPFLVFKGPSLADAYGGIARRPFSDNDLLVSRSDFDRVERTLLGLGFNERKRSDRQRNGYLLVHGEYTFGRAVGSDVSTVDVHTNVAPLGYAYDGSYERLAGPSRTIEVGGQEVRALGWPDLFLVLCVNALKDQWSRLRLASDLVAVAPLIDDWTALEERARQDKCLRIYRMGVLVAHDAIDRVFPPDVVIRARADRGVSKLAGRVVAYLAQAHASGGLSGLQRARLMLGVQDGPGGLARYVGYVAARRLSHRWVTPFSRGS